MMLCYVCIIFIHRDWAMGYIAPVWTLTLWGQYNMVAILKMVIWFDFFKLKNVVFWFKFHWNILPDVRLIISQHNYWVLHWQQAITWTIDRLLYFYEASMWWLVLTDQWDLVVHIISFDPTLLVSNWVQIVTVIRKSALREKGMDK